jgi:cytoskeletal protein RodZ
MSKSAELAVVVSDSPNPEALSALRCLGKTLRQGREVQGLELAVLAARLNMGVEQLQALEEADACRLPEPVFVIAQARRIASSLAINIDGPLQTLRDNGQFQAKPIKVAKLTQRAPTRPAQTSGRVAITAAILVALSGAGAAGWQQWQRHQARPIQQQKQPQLLSEISPANRSKERESGSLKPDQLQLTSSQPSWLEIKTKTGTTLFRGTFTGKRIFPLGSGLEVLAGRPDLVRTQIGGGAPQPLGPIDQVRWRSFRAPAP